MLRPKHYILSGFFIARDNCILQRIGVNYGTAEQMKIETVFEAKNYIGDMLYWDDVSNRYSITRSGVLTDVYGSRLEFDEQQDYRPIGDFKNLRNEK